MPTILQVIRNTKDSITENIVFYLGIHLVRLVFFSMYCIVLYPYPFLNVSFDGLQKLTAVFRDFNNGTGVH